MKVNVLSVLFTMFTGQSNCECLIAAGYLNVRIQAGCWCCLGWGWVWLMMVLGMVLGNAVGDVVSAFLCWDTNWDLWHALMFSATPVLNNTTVNSIWSYDEVNSFCCPWPRQMQLDVHNVGYVIIVSWHGILLITLSTNGILYWAIICQSLYFGVYIWSSVWSSY